MNLINYIDFTKAEANNPLNPCTTNPGRVYFQYSCVIDDDALNIKREQGLFISMCACFVCLLWLIIIYYLQKTAKVDFELWDIENLTCGDFTIEYQVDQEMWDTFNVQLANHTQLPAGGAAANHVGSGLPVLTFEAFIEHYFTRKLNRVPKVIEDVEIRIANITLAFDNPKLLGLLAKRGSLIAASKYSKVPKINEEIGKLISEKKSELIRPVSAFISFER